MGIVQTKERQTNIMSDLETPVSGYVPLAQALTVFGGAKGSFYHLVHTDQIGTLPGKNKRDTRYRLRDIQRIRQERERGSTRRKAYTKLKPIHIDWLAIADIPALLTFNRDVYGDDLPLNEMAVYQERYKINPHLAMAAFSLDRSVCYGCIGLLPLPESVCLDVLSGKRQETEISNSELETYERSGGYTLLCTNVAVRPERRDLVIRMLQKVIDFWVDEQYPARWIQRIYAQAWSRDGERTMQQFFMMPLPAPYPTDAYYLDMARASRSKIIASYHNRILERYHLDALPDEMLERYTPPLPITTTIDRIVTQARAERTTTSTLPPGYVAFPEMAERHNVNVNSLRSDLREKKITAERGHWLYRGKALSLAFSPEQHRAFSQFYRHRSSFQWCPDCLDEHGTL